MDRYQLAPVRDARARDERVRRGDLAAAVGDARATEGILADARGRTAEARRLIAVALAAPVASNAAELARAERYLVRLRRDLVAAIGEELRAEAAHDARLGVIDLARRTLTRARADREIIERHFERWREARHKLAERRDD